MDFFVDIFANVQFFLYLCRRFVKRTIMTLTIEDIQKLPEGQTFDCKSIQVSAKSLVIPIVAMANADGGTIAVGISDTSRRIEGIDQEPKHLNDLLCVPMDLCVPSVDAKFSYLPCTDEHGVFVTNRNYSQFAIQELVVNSVCHRDYSIIGTEIQIKMFDDRIVFETPGHLPGLVRPDNIRHTHFSRNPKIALFMKAYKLVKEFGEGVDRICSELEKTGTPILTFTFHPNSFILLTTIHEEVFPDAGKTPGGLIDIQTTEGNLSASRQQDGSKLAVSWQ